MKLASFRHLFRPISQWILSISVIAVLSGCGDDQIKVYTVPKEKPVAEQHFEGDGHNHGSESVVPQVKWKLPEGWEEAPGGRMRLAGFKVTKGGEEADVAITPLPGVVGKDLEIVNLWREQVKLPALSEEQMVKEAEQVKVGPFDGRLFNMVSTEKLIHDEHAARILVAMLSHEGTSWFIKMTGEDALVAGQKPVFVEFLKSLEFHKAPSQPAPSEPVVSEDGPAKRPDWTVPASWMEVPPTTMLLAKFVAGEESAKAEITVSVFPGDVGGALGNVNRWRGQINLEPIQQEELSKLATALDVKGGKAMLVDMTGDSGRLIGVILPKGGKSWFYKMMGNAETVNREKGAFLQFVKTVDYAKGH